MSIIFFVILLFGTCHSANILFFFTGGTYSHDIAVWPLAVGLADRNHSVTFFSTHSKKPWNDSRIKVIAPLRLQEINNYYLGDTLKFRLDGKEKDFWKTLIPWSYSGCEYVLQNPEKPETYDIFFKEKFDIVILDAALCDCGHILGYYHKAKVIVSDSTSVLPWFHHIYGFPQESSWIPATSTFFEYPMKFLDLFENYFEPIYWTYSRRTLLYPKLDLLIKELIKNEKETVASFSEIERQASLIFVNTHSTVELPRSFPPNVIQVGGMQLWGQKNASISKEIETFIENAEQGVILIAMGSSVDFSRLPHATRTAFFDAIRHFPKIHFIGQASGKKPSDCPENLLLQQWLPQKEIFAYPTTIAGITHGGLNGILEATWSGIPLITFPIFAEQDHQSYKLEARGVGIRLEVRGLREDILVSAISKITTDLSYKENMKKLQAAFRDRPHSPLDTAIYWTEYLTRHDNLSYMQPLTYQPHTVLLQDWVFDQFSFILTVVSTILAIILITCLYKVRLSKHK